MLSSTNDLSNAASSLPATAVDVRNAYRLLLGRPIESLEIVNIKTTLTIDAMVEEILCSDEFVEFVEGPIRATGTAEAWLYQGFPRPRLLEWAAETLPVGAARRRLVKAQTWSEALSILYGSPTFRKYLRSKPDLARLTDMCAVFGFKDNVPLARTAL